MNYLRWRPFEVVQEVTIDRPVNQRRTKGRETTPSYKEKLPRIAMRLIYSPPSGIAIPPSFFPNSLILSARVPRPALLSKRNGESTYGQESYINFSVGPSNWRFLFFLAGSDFYDVSFLVFFRILAKICPYLTTRRIRRSHAGGAGPRRSKTRKSRKHAGPSSDWFSS